MESDFLNRVNEMYQSGINQYQDAINNMLKKTDFIQKEREEQKEIR